MAAGPIGAASHIDEVLSAETGDLDVPALWCACRRLGQDGGHIDGDRLHQ